MAFQRKSQYSAWYQMEIDRLAAAAVSSLFLFIHICFVLFEIIVLLVPFFFLWIIYFLLRRRDFNRKVYKLLISTTLVGQANEWSSCAHIYSFISASSAYFFPFAYIIIIIINMPTNWNTQYSYVCSQYWVNTKRSHRSAASNSTNL